jgi:hypothetical protein
MGIPDFREARETEPGLFAVFAMLVTYANEARRPWFVFAFALACSLGSTFITTLTALSQVTVRSDGHAVSALR